MQVKNITTEYIEPISKAHKQIFGKEHFTSNFPIKLLIKYFEVLYNHFEIKKVIFDEKGILAGYLFAGTDPHEKINSFVKNNFFQILLIMFLHPQHIIEKIHGLVFRKQNEVIFNQDEITIFLIAIKNEYQGKGLGKLLISDFEDTLKTMNIFEYYLAVRNTNKQAINFYNSTKFINVLTTKYCTYFRKKMPK
jgi:ribosomal protein S18 acetylase RimI-like enzyme